MRLVFFVSFFFLGRTVCPLTFFSRLNARWKTNSQRSDKRGAESVELSNSATEHRLDFPLASRLAGLIKSGRGRRWVPLRRMLMCDWGGRLRRLEEDVSV